MVAYRVNILNAHMATIYLVTVLSCINYGPGKY